MACPRGQRRQQFVRYQQLERRLRVSTSGVPTTCVLGTSEAYDANAGLTVDFEVESVAVQSTFSAMGFRLVDRNGVFVSSFARPQSFDGPLEVCGATGTIDAELNIEGCQLLDSSFDRWRIQIGNGSVTVLVASSNQEVVLGTTSQPAGWVQDELRIEVGQFAALPVFDSEIRVRGISGSAN